MLMAGMLESFTGVRLRVLKTTTNSICSLPVRINFGTATYRYRRCCCRGEYSLLLLLAEELEERLDILSVGRGLTEHTLETVI